MLEIKKLNKSFGGLKALSDVDLNVAEGRLFGLIGPNGAGKTTAFNIISGLIRPDLGDIIYSGENIAGRKPYDITARGIARTFQNIRLFKNLSVLDNVKIAYHHRVKYGLAEALLFRFGRFVREEKTLTDTAIGFLEIFGLEKLANELAQNLPYGLQRRLEIARALATGPALLLLDEPAAGMHPSETKELMELINFIRKKFKLTILLIEHDMNLVMGICEYIYVLDYGKIIAQGPPAKVRSNPKVIEAYLGEETV